MQNISLNQTANRAPGGSFRPCVSVIVPVYNVEDYLVDCLESLLAQTLRSIEIVAVDDGSSDGSSALLREYAAEYPGRIRSFRKPNGGLSDARNFGLRHAQGEYIGFVDSDDWVEPNMYEAMFQRAVDTNSEVVVCGARVHPYHNDEEVVVGARNIDLRGKISNFGGSVAENPSILFSSRSYACTKLFHRRLFDDWEFEFPVGQWFEDSAVIYNVMFAANRVSCLENNFYHYRFNRSGAITTTLSPKIFDIFKSCDSILDFYRDKHLEHPKADYVLEQLVRTHIIARYQLFVGNTDKGFDQQASTWAEKRLSWSFVQHAFSYLDTEFPGWQGRYLYRLSAKPPVWWRARKSRFLMFVLIFVPRRSLQSFKSLRQGLKRQASRLEQRQRQQTKRRAVAEKNEVNLSRRRKALQQHGFEVLSRLDDVFREAEVMHFVDFGTLLSFIRDGGLMPDDSDLDIGVFADEDQKLDIFAALTTSGFSHYRTYLFEERIVGYLFFSLDTRGKKSVKFRINFYENADNQSRCLRFHYLPDSGLPLRARFVTEMRYGVINGCVSIEVQGHQVRVPENYKSLLREKYGSSWRTPDPSWDDSKSPAATPLEVLGRYITAYRMPVERLSELQREQVKVLEAFESVCEANNLRFYLAEGTLLGAARYRGFIPQDGGVSVSMSRSDYVELLSLPIEAWPQGFSMWNHLTDPDYHLSFSKVVAQAHNGFRNTLPRDIKDKFSGPGIDVLPLDRATEIESPEMKAVAQEINSLQNVMLWKAGILSKKKSKAMPANPELIPMTIFQSWAATLAAKDNEHPNARFVVSWCSSYDHTKQTMPEDWYGEPSMLMFEGKLRPCPNQYDQMLTAIYGDYMALPAEHKRASTSHHMIYDRWA